MSKFLMGINYWPRSSAMYMWERFDLGEMREDFARIKSLNLDVVRFFLLWEYFAPTADAVDANAVRRFEQVVSAIGDAGLRAMPTLFCGHMSGVNWLAAWSLDPATPHGRFRTIANGSTSPFGIGDFYADETLLRAQTLLAERVGECVRDHPALYAWDLGNEFSNMREPRTPADAAAWSARLTDTLQRASGAPVTAGTHGEDLERDRHLRLSSLDTPFDFATMHGYSVYSAFARGRLDANVVPFLAQLAQSCSGKSVLFSEFGNPTCPPGTLSPENALPFACLTEDEMAVYAYGVLDRLQRRGAIGALWWCWADYAPALAELPPFDCAPHEMHFGIVRADGTFKPVAQRLQDFAREARNVTPLPPPIVDEAQFYKSLPAGMANTYQEYCRAD